MAFKAETHIECLGIFINIYLGQIAMTFLTIDPRRNMRSMVELHKVWHDRYRNPLKWCVILHSLDQGF